MNFALFLFACEVISVVWGCGGEWPEFAIVFFLIFSFSFTAILIQRMIYNNLNYEFSDNTYKCLTAFLVLLLTEAFVQMFFFNTQTFSVENGLQIVKTGISTLIPSTVNTEFIRGGANRAFILLFCAISCFIGILLYSSQKKFSIILLKIITINIVLMAIFAIYQKASKNYFMYGIIYSDAMKYGSFFVSNSASAVFNLGGCGCISLLFIHYSKKNILRYIIWITGCVICAYATFDSQSIGGRIMLGIQIVIILGFLLIRFCNLKKLLLALTVLFVNCCIFLSTYVDVDSDSFKNISNSLSSRHQLNMQSLEILKESHLWGIGGDAYGFNVSPKLVELTKNSPYRIPQITYRAHNDILEFILEYGIIGTIFMMGALICFIKIIVSDKDKIYSRTNYILVIGVFICVSHSLFDIHLHVISILTICAIYTALCISNFQRDNI